MTVVHARLVSVQNEGLAQATILLFQKLTGCCFPRVILLHEIPSFYDALQ